jgi:predicted transposase/invertase (TIGR01784 family)
MQSEFKYADLLDDDVFRKIFEVSELINMDEVTRSKVIEKMTTERDLRNQMEYARQEAIAEGHAEGRAEGRAEGLAEAARKMLEAGMALDVVADILQIPKDQLKEML